MVSSIVGGIGATPVPLNNTEKAQRATLQENSSSASEAQTQLEYDISANITLKQQINTEWMETPPTDYYYSWAEQYQEIRKKVWGENTTQQLRISAGYYDKAVVVTNGNSTYFDMKVGSQNYDPNASRVYVVRIDPYSSLTDTEINLSFTLENDFETKIPNIDSSNPLYNSNINMQYQVNAFKTSHTYAQKYIDAPMTNSYNPNDIYYEIRNNSSYYTEYPAQWTARTISTIRNGTITNLHGSKTITINGQMPNQTYFMAILIQRRLTAVNTTETEEVLYGPSEDYELKDNWGTITNGVVNWAYDYNNSVRITGYYTPAPVYEVVDLPGMMFNILSMPFTFISTAFNLTLFPGTPYVVHISSLFLVVLGTLIFVFIIKKVLGK